MDSRASGGVGSPAREAATKEGRLRPLNAYRTRVRRNEALFAGALLLPALAVLGLVIFWPVVQAALLSLKDATLLTATNAPFAGMENFAKIPGDPVFRAAVVNTLVLTAVSIAGSLVLGMALALVLNESIPGKGFFRGLALIPWVVPGVVVSLLFLYMFNSQVGVIDWALVRLGITDGMVDWFGSTKNALWAVAIANIWNQTPFYMLMILAGLQTVPQDEYEAAKIDGANAVQRFRYVTLPNIRVVLTIVIALQVIYNFNNFDLIWATTQGGPINATTTLSVYVYRTGFVGLDIGYAAAIGVVMLAALLLFSVFYVRAMEGREER
jgi:ABC-type sugar transport system permease subunit